MSPNPYCQPRPPTTRAARPLAAILLLAALPCLAQNAVITHAEQPSRLIRKTTVYGAPAGVRLQAGDIVESGARTVQIEWANGARLALGPASSVLITDAAGLPAASLLRGWTKFATTAPAGGRMTVSAGALDTSAAGASGIAHLASDRAELFVDAGTVSVGGTAVANEYYAARQTSRPLEIAPRAPRLFLDQMPRAFQDPLVAVARRPRDAAPTPQGEVTPNDVAAWRDAAPLLRRRLAAQLAPRLADPAFRKEAAVVLENHPEWRDAQRRNATARSRANSLSNHLF